LQHNANTSQGSHFLFTFLITFVQINKIDLTPISYLILSPNTNLLPNPKPDPNPKHAKNNKKHHCESAEVRHIA